MAVPLSKKKSHFFQKLLHGLIVVVFWDFFSPPDQFKFNTTCYVFPGLLTVTPSPTFLNYSVWEYRLNHRYDTYYKTLSPPTPAPLPPNFLAVCLCRKVCQNISNISNHSGIPTLHTAIKILLMSRKYFPRLSVFSGSLNAGMTGVLCSAAENTAWWFSHFCNNSYYIKQK